MSAGESGTAKNNPNPTVDARSSVGRAPWYHGTPKPFIIGVTGGSASGKTSVCEAIVSHLNVPWVGLLSMDRYYNIGDKERALAAQGLYNFDHPDAFDVDRLYEDILQLKAGKAVDVPIYDFRSHSRIPQTDRMYGVDIVIVEGILLFYAPKVRELLDLKIYVDTDNDLRLARRIRRDIVERARSVDSVLDQYQRTVKPSFEQFIQPTKRFADLIVPWNDRNNVAIDLLTQHIKIKLDHRQSVTLQNTLPSFQIKSQQQQQKQQQQQQQIPITPQKQKQQDEDVAHIEPLGQLPGSASNTNTNNSSPFVGTSGVLIQSPSLQPATVLEAVQPKASLPVMMNPEEASRRISLSATPVLGAKSGMLSAQGSVGGGSVPTLPTMEIPHMSLNTIMDMASPQPPEEPTTPEKEKMEQVQLAKNVVEQQQQQQQQGNTSGTLSPIVNQFSQFTQHQEATAQLQQHQQQIGGDQETIKHLKHLYEQSYLRSAGATGSSLNPRKTVLYPNNFPTNLLVLPPTKSLTAIHTQLRDRTTSLNDFRFAMSRLVRIICTQAMNLVTYTPQPVVTPTGETFNGLHCETNKVVGVSIVRAGEAFEQSVREVIKDIAIGKVVIQHDGNDKSTGPRLYYAKLPIVNDPNTKILLFDGVLATGSAVIMAIHVLLDHGARPENIIFCCASAAPEGIYNLSSIFPQVKIVASCLEQGLDENLFVINGIGFIGDRYFGSYSNKTQKEQVKKFTTFDGSPATVLPLDSPSDE